MQARETALEEAPGGHFVPAVIVCIADDKAGQNEEEIHSQVAVVDVLRPKNRDVGLETVKQNYHEGGHAAKPVQNLVTGLGCQIYVFFCHIIVIPGPTGNLPQR